MNQHTLSKGLKRIGATTMRTKEAAFVATLGLAIFAPGAGHGPVIRTCTRTRTWLQLRPGET